jgi:Raf kinase inhibitor-like YbhB/YbcL family protein
MDSMSGFESALNTPSPYDALPPVPSFTLTSKDLTDGGLMPAAHVSGGENQSPQLSWSGAPQGTEGYAITCFDPDAPTGSGWWHWFVLGVGVGTTSVGRGELPAGAYCLRNDAGNKRYDGAAPPPGHGTHRYLFAVHALDEANLGVSADAAPAVGGFNLTFHTLARAVLTVGYSE